MIFGGFQNGVYSRGVSHVLETETEEVDKIVKYQNQLQRFKIAQKVKSD